MPYPVKCFFEIYEDMIQILLMFCGASPGSKSGLFFSNNLPSLGFEPVQDDFRHGFTCTKMTDEANDSVILEEL